MISRTNYMWMSYIWILRSFLHLISVLDVVMITFACLCSTPLKELLYLLNWSLCGPQNLSGYFWEEKFSCPYGY